MRPLPQFAIFAVVGQLILLASAWLLPAVSEYHLVGDNISELAIGQYGFLQTLAFVISGLGVLALAYAIHRLTAGIRGSLLGSVFIAIYGLGALVVAIFPTDRIDSTADVWSQSTTGWSSQHHGVRRVSQRHHRHADSDLDLCTRCALAIPRCGICSASRRRVGAAVRPDGRTLDRTHAAAADNGNLGLANHGRPTRTHYGCSIGNCAQRERPQAPECVRSTARSIGD